MSSEQESNPELEALQAELSLFRRTPFELTGSEVEETIRDLVKKSANGKAVAFAFVGMAGAGKSKVIEKIARHFDVEPTHVRDLAVDNPAIRKIEKEFYRISELVPGIEKDYLDLAFRKKSPYYVVDGFPRTLLQAVELYRRAVEKKIRIQLVEIRLQDDREVFQSFYRQTQRATHRIKKGLLFGQAEEEETARIMAKIRRTIELDLYVIELLRAVGADIITIDGTHGPSKMFNQLKILLGLDANDETES